MLEPVELGDRVVGASLGVCACYCGVMKLFRVGGTGSLAVRSIRWVVAMLGMVAAALVLGVPGAQAGTANGGLPGAGPNPIAHIKWGVPHDDDPWSVYQSATGSNKKQLAKLAMTPRAVWLGWENPNRLVKAETAAAVAASQNGNPNALTEFATFELNPWENQKANGVDKPAVRASWNVNADEAWYRNMAAGIGSARALVIEQVDMPVALKISSTAPEQINTYAARVLSANRHTTVYIDAGTFGWTSATQDAALLIGNGIRYARGFALDDTDYDPTATEDEYGTKIVAALAKFGVRGKHFIVNTDENGQPYKPEDVAGKGINDAPVCHNQIQTACQRTGIPPTINVASPQWHLNTKTTQDAKRYCDAYVWSGQPWDIDAGPFQPKRALWLAENEKYTPPTSH
jgi:endoglucanase